MKKLLKVMGFVSLTSFGLMSLPAQAVECNQGPVSVNSQGIQLCLSIATISVQVVLSGLTER